MEPWHIIVGLRLQYIEQDILNLAVFKRLTLGQEPGFYNYAISF